MKKILIFLALSVATCAAQTSTELNPGRIGWTLNPNTSIQAGAIADQNETVTYTGADGVSPLLVDAHGSTLSGTSVLNILTPSTGAQKGLVVTAGPNTNIGYAAITGNVNSTGCPGLELGPGGTAARDTFLYRDCITPSNRFIFSAVPLFPKGATVAYSGSNTQAALTVDASASTVSTYPTMQVTTPSTGNIVAISATKGTDTQPFFTLGGPGGISQGLNFGQGGSTPTDTVLWRNGANSLTTGYFNVSTLQALSFISAAGTITSSGSATTGGVISPIFESPTYIGATAPNTCASGSYYLQPVAGTYNAWEMCNNGTLSALGSFNPASPGPIGGTTPATVNATASITSATPMSDIRAFGAVVDGATDIGAALTSAIAQACTTSGVVFLPCGGNGCYLANGAALNGCSTNLQVKLQGTLKMGSTLVVPNNVSFMCDGGGSMGQFNPSGPGCNVTATSAHGTMGTTIASGSQTFTPTFTAGSIANLQVGAGISVVGNVACTITSITRTSASTNNVTATVATPCRIPQGALAVVAGVTDSSFNASPIVLQDDYIAGTITWTQSGSAATSSGGTITGTNDDSFETATITAISGSTVTALFAHAHNSADVWGAVGVMVPSNSFTAHHFQGLLVQNAYGAGFWFPRTAETLLDGVAVNATAWPSSIPVEFASSYGWRITNSSLVTSSYGYPMGLRITSLPTYNGWSDPADLNMIVDGNTFIMGGIKVDTNLLSGPQAKIGDLRLRDVTIEQPAGYGVLIDPRNAGGTSRTFTFSNLMLQDNFLNYSNCLIGYTDPANYGAVVFNTLNSTLAQNCIANQYYGGSMVVNGVDYTQGTINLPRYLGRVGNLNDGIALEGEARGSGANMSPSIIPYATANVTVNPALWTPSSGGAVNTGILAPDGTSTAGELVAATATNPRVPVYSFNTATSTGDAILSGVWCMPGVNATGPCRGASSFDAYWIYSYNAADTFDNGSEQYAYPNMYESSFTSDWWHPIVSMNVITGAGSATSHVITMWINGPQTLGQGTRFWQPFFIYIPISAKPSGMTTAQWYGEIARWRTQLMHGHVSPNMPAGVLDIGSPYKLYWGSDTNLYRGAAGVVQTDGSINVNSASGSYQMNGNAILPHTMTGYTGAGVTAVTAGSSGSPASLGTIATNTAMAGCTSGSYMKADGSGCATPTGAGTVTGTGTGGYIASWTGSGAGQSGIGSSHLDDGITTAGTITSTEPLQVSGLPAGCVQLPCAVAKVAPATYSGTGSGAPFGTMLASAPVGQYRACGALDITVAGSAGTVYIYLQYVSDGHSFSLTPVNSTSVTTQWTSAQGCLEFYADASQNIVWGLGNSGLAGSPTVRYTLALERMQ